MSSINAPQWFKDALDDWPTAVWLPLPDLIGDKETGDWGYFSPKTEKRKPLILSDDITENNYKLYQYQYPNALFMPFEKGVWGEGINSDDYAPYSPIYMTLYKGFMEEPALKNGAIIIMGYGICGQGIDRLDVSLPTASYTGWGSSIEIVENTSGYSIAARVATRYALELTEINGGNDVEYTDNPPHAYHDFCLPQFRCAVLGISPSGDCVVGQGHPMYAHMRNQQQDYISIGTIADISNLKAIRNVVYTGNMGGEFKAKSIPTFAGVTFVEVLIPGVAPISFPAIPGASNWWRNHNLTSEGGASGLVLDKRGFPVSGFNYTPGMIPLDPY